MFPEPATLAGSQEAQAQGHAANLPYDVTADGAHTQLFWCKRVRREGNKKKVRREDIDEDEEKTHKKIMEMRERKEGGLLLCVSVR